MSNEPAANLQVDPYLRIRAEKVTQLLDMVGEMGLAVSAVTHHPGLTDLELEGFEMAAHRLEMLVREAQDMVSSLRLIPVGQVFHRMDRLVRDLSRQTGKALEIQLEGEDVEIDKAVVDLLGDPLMHLIRNSADHGLEKPDDRVKAGKPEQGKITLKAAQRGREVLIIVADDGRGLNREAILERARSRGLLPRDKEPLDSEIWNCIFQSGFSTASAVTNLSGRGVGMDVVKNTIQALRGRIEVNTIPNQGTQTTLVIPLSLAFLESLIVRTQDCLYAIPIDAVNEVFQPDESEMIRSSASGDVMIMRQGIAIPLINLINEKDNRQLKQIVVVIQTSWGRLGLMMDEIIGQQQVVMKPLTGHLVKIRGGAGCALLSSGEVAIALDVEQLIKEKSAENSKQPGISENNKK
jgi:two-component system, chemotaxis family, sensor kinase CheA